MKSRTIIVLILITVFIFSIRPNSLSSKERVGNGIWVHIDTFLDKSDEEIEEISKFLVLKDISNVFILAKSVEGTLLYKKYEEKLKRVVKIFKNFGLKVHFYIPITIDPSFLKKNPKEASFHSPDKNHYYPYKDPDLRYVNLTSKKYLSYIKIMVRELILNFDADGIQLDYIRYPNIYYGYSEEEKLRFLNRGGDWSRILSIMREERDIFSLYDKGDRDVVLWAKVRSEIVNDFVGSVKSFISGISSKVLFSVVLIQSCSSFLSYEEGGKDSYPWGILHFSQSYEDLSKLTDFVSPLAYHRNYKKSVEWIGEIIRNTKRRVSCGILCGIGVNDRGVNIERAIDICKDEGVNFSLFRLGTFIPVMYEVKPEGKLTYRIRFKFLKDFYEKSHKDLYLLNIGDGLYKGWIKEGEDISFYSPLSKVKIYFDDNTPVLLSDPTLNLLSFMRIKIGKNRYIFDGKEMFFDTPPFIVNGRTMVPVRFISEDFGCKVLWNSGEVEIEKGERSIKLWIGKREIEINGERFTIDSTPILKDGRTFVPIRFILEALNLFVYWNGEKEEVEIEGNVREEGRDVIVENVLSKEKILRDLSFYSSSSVLLMNPKDAIDLNPLLNTLKRRGIKVFVKVGEDEVENWLKTVKTYSLKLDYLYVDKDKPFVVDKSGERFDVFVVEDDNPKEALLSYTNYNFISKGRYFVKVKDPIIEKFLSYFTNLDKRFMGFIKAY